MGTFERVIWIVLDSVGIGPLPDAADYGDVGRNTLGHIAESRPVEIPTLVRLGLANIAPLKHLTPTAEPAAAFGKGATHSPGKDTTTGHWEMAGIWLDQAFPVYPNGFPREIIDAFEKQIGRGTIGNKPASGTEIIKELGEEHVRNRAKNPRWAESSRPRDCAAVRRDARKFCSDDATARLRCRTAETNAARRIKGSIRPCLWSRQNSRHLQRSRRRRLRHHHRQHRRNAKALRCGARKKARPDLLQPGRLRHAVWPSQR